MQNTSVYCTSDTNPKQIGYKTLWSSITCTKTAIYFYLVHKHHSLSSCNNKLFLVIT